MTTWKKDFFKKLLAKEKAKAKPNELLISLYSGKMTYKEYLQTEHWKEIKKTVDKHYGYKCVVCGEDEIRLDHHHLNYDNIGKETVEDVILVCPICHKDIHAEIKKLKNKKFKQKIMSYTLKYFT